MEDIQPPPEPQATDDGSSPTEMSSAAPEAAPVPDPNPSSSAAAEKDIVDTEDAVDIPEEVSPSLLEGNDKAAPRPQPAASPSSAGIRASTAATAPPENRGRLSLVARGLFANAGGRNEVGGRLGGAQLDVGQSWNVLGYALTASAWGGSVVLPERTGAEMNAMFGVGPTLTLGRKAIVSRGIFDVRVGYDVFYGVVNRRRSDSTLIATRPGNDAVFVQAENLVPHGPRAQVTLAFYSPASKRGFVHAAGLTAGYQGLVGSFRGTLPFTHMLTLGVSYWMG